MTLLESVTHVCRRLAPGGWHSLMLAHGLDLLAEPLAAELVRPMKIDRNLSGFEDFAPDGTRAIEAAVPSRSLLYHALASPRVTVDETGTDLLLFPTPGEIETVLNYVYSIAPPTFDQLRLTAAGAPLAVVAFASEYRCAADTVHGRHADLCFSRTGIARVGTAPARYDARQRCFLPFVDDDVHGIRVMPVRYSAYIAMQLRGDAQRFGPMDFQAEVDPELDFWVPLHKLFDGDQCLAGMELSVTLENHQINEKLRHIHLRHSGTGWEEPQISQAPFVVTENLADWAPADELGAGLLVPQSKARLVEPAQIDGRPLTFLMPANTAGMVHGRHKVNADGSIENLNDRADVEALVRQGGYEALHYQDATADGWVRPDCPALNDLLPTVAAYSIIGPPDFYPLCSQRKLLHWVREEPLLPDSDVWHARLEALSNVRYCANLNLEDQLFSHTDRGVTAIVASAEPCPRDLSQIPPAPSPRPSSLPDGAAGVFGPGWEVGWVRQKTPDAQWINVLAGYQMASPFPEDAKICAALGSFWPGVAPDSARVFEPRSSLHTIIPLTDKEIGQGGAIAWDDQRGPQLIVEDNRLFAQYHAYVHADYTQVALQGRFSLRLTGHTSQTAYERRVVSMYRVYRALGADRDNARRNAWPLLSFLEVQRPDNELDNAQQQAGVALEGWVQRFSMYKRGAVSIADDDFKLRHVEVERQVLLFVSTDLILMKQDAGPWQVAVETL
ncbi:hypothetical protein PspCFBP13508_14210 [Pseudomonas sp. CFBP13508]|jgi:hypothetical protein|uniref:hypothetical protein n=1 Tax=Pseudomonas sp. CFBP13508 TaxID=2184009 RepID=UPI0010C0C05B|nr:hypothetical protein [Pseudomonas sp. CFBP13508]TKJ71804.1 hypothetical protein PspCFBP13508_14210 [Pseudomonas sp. CFBP13508]